MTVYRQVTMCQVCNKPEDDGDHTMCFFMVDHAHRFMMESRVGHGKVRLFLYRLLWAFRISPRRSPFIKEAK